MPMLSALLLFAMLGGLSTCVAEAIGHAATEAHESDSAQHEHDRDASDHGAHGCCDGLASLIGAALAPQGAAVSCRPADASVAIVSVEDRAAVMISTARGDVPRFARYVPSRSSPPTGLRGPPPHLPG